MDKTQLYALTGHLEQVASVRRVVYQDGDAAGLAVPNSVTGLWNSMSC